MQKYQYKKIQPLANYYCDAIRCSLGEFLDYEDENEVLSKLTEEEIQTLCDFAALKNKLAGVKKLFLKVPDFGYAVKSLEKFDLDGKEIISAVKFGEMPTSAMVGHRVMFEVESLLDYNQNVLSQLADFAASVGISVIFRLGTDLEEVGKVVNAFKCSPAEAIESFGFLDRECYVRGLNFIDKDDQKLLSSYDAFLIFSPRWDGEEGKGAINLYNFIYNDLKFGFSSGGCYNIDMLAEGKLAKQNTANLMYDPKLVSSGEILKHLTTDGEEIDIAMDELEREDNILDKQVRIESSEVSLLHENVKEIARKIKEN